MPSPWAAFTSAPSRSSDRTVSMSPRIAASATGDSGAGAEAHSTNPTDSAPSTFTFRPLRIVASGLSEAQRRFRAR